MIASAPSSLADALVNRIRLEGPITFAEWMETALYAPEGYYCRNDLQRWGRSGDYRTSSERSQLFAATFARYFAKLFDDLGQPAEWTTVEVGAGDGAFAEEVLQTLDRDFPQVFAATHFVIDEISPDARARASERLTRFSDRLTFSELSKTDVSCGVIFSNELLDAFPVHLMRMEKGELKELYIDVGENNEFGFVSCQPSDSRLVEYVKESRMTLAEGQTIEINLAIKRWITSAAQALQRGYLVTVDYGSETHHLLGRFDGTLRAFKSHGLSDELLTQPGDQDLTSTIDWSFVKRCGDQVGFDVVTFTRQDRFLLDAGLPQQLELALSRATSESERLSLTTGAREMILPDGMASHFQVLVQSKRT